MSLNQTLASYGKLASEDVGQTGVEASFCGEKSGMAPDGSYRLSDQRQSRYFRRRYVVDRFVAGILLVLSSPLTLILFLLIKLTSPGPGFYRQNRLGLDGETFQIIKLRSMVSNAERPGEAIWSVKNDSRITSLGRIMRRLHLDELPQLWNVAKGEMALIGPRPERPEICVHLADQIDDYYYRITVKPGVTGLAQINLPPDETIEDVQRKQILDVLYIDEADLWLDSRMLVATTLRMLGFGGETVMRIMRLCRRDYLIRECPDLLVDEQPESPTDVPASCRGEDALSGTGSEKVQKRCVQAD